MLTQQEYALVIPAKAPPVPPRSRIDRFVWILPVLLTAAVALYRCSSMVLWWDELSTLDIASRPTGSILATASNVDAVHTLYYLFMHVWIGVFGHTPLALRMPSILAMCGATACTAAAARRLFGRRVGLASGFVFAMIPGVARYACEARSYGFVVLGAAASLLLLLRALERPGVRNWVAYGAVLGVTGALNLIALITVAGHLVAVLVARQHTGRRGLLTPFGLAALGAVLLNSPILLLGVLEAHTQLGDPPHIALSGLPGIWQSTACSTAFSVLVLLALPSLATHRTRSAALTILSCATLPVFVLWFVSLHSIGFSYYARYLLFVVPCWAIAVAAAADRIVEGRLVGVGAAVLITALAVTHDQIALHSDLSHFWFDYPGRGVVAEDYPAAASVIDPRYQTGDSATFGASQHIALGVNEYLPPDEQLPDVFVQHGDLQNNSLSPTYCREVAVCAVKAPDRVWLLEPGPTTFSAEPAQWTLSLLFRYHIVEIWHVPGITITLLTLGTQAAGT